MTTTKTAHTPAPWKAEYTSEGWEIVTSKNKVYNLSIGMFDRDGMIIPKKLEPNLESDARLIAASPELLDLIKRINYAFYVKGTRNAMIEVMAESKTLIHKAEGRDL